MLDTTEQSIVPFLKWAGGKRWLTSGYEHLFPTKFERYIEPFVGGGAVFFHLQPAKALLSDQNPDLINVYSAIRSDWKKVVTALKRHDRNHGKKYYYLERARDRRADHERAAQFLYLNRTCWNGLYRVNLQGEFNVPIGTKDTVLLESDDFETASNALSKAELRISDFEPILDEARRGDFAFIDPPYITAHNMNGFVKYNEKLFSWQDQIRLRDAIVRAKKRGVKILMSNADHRSVRDLYQEVGKLTSLKRASVIAGSSEFRSSTTELLLKTFD